MWCTHTPFITLLAFALYQKSFLTDNRAANFFFFFAQQRADLQPIPTVILSNLLYTMFSPSTATGAGLGATKYCLLTF